MTRYRTHNILADVAAAQRTTAAADPSTRRCGRAGVAPRVPASGARADHVSTETTARLGVGGVKKVAAQGVTHATAAECPAQFRLEFDDGSALAVHGRGLIGREPAAGAGKLVAHLVALADDTYSMSRTHLEFGVDENGLWVRDCASTNGSELEVNGCCTPLEPGLPVPAPAGCTIHMGARQVKVRTITNRWAIGAATIAWGAATHVGAVRKSNQDAYGSAPPVFVVADGVGGHVAGDVAAREAVKALLPLAGHPQVTAEMLKACLADARARISRIPVNHGRPPGTTLSGVITTQVDHVPSWMVVNIGDSRTYRLDSDGLRQLSIDHSVVQQLVDTGVITASSAWSHPARNLLTRALIAEIEHPADVWLLPIIAGDRILVCSDGLTREVDDGLIARVLRAIPDPQAAANELVNAAVDAGGHDNVTAVVIDAAVVDVVPQERG
ncbi:MAG: family protein phosphatase [Mycobacterium sp.]|nr:family protein phosphatase [Mycobacterium sp.]